MNWRSGLLLAGINLAVAMPLILMLEANDTRSLRQREANIAEAEREAATRPPEPAKSGRAETADQTETVSFNPCGMWVHYPVQVVVEQAATYPTMVFTGWRMICPPKRSISGRMHADSAWIPIPSAEAQLNVARRKADWGFEAVIFLQWFFVGSFPLVRPRKWWAEPGILVTGCIVVASFLALFPLTEELAQLPALIAILVWILWFGLLIWKPVHLAWQSTLGGLRRLSN